MQFWAIIVDSFRESVDRKIFWVLVGATLLIAVVMACIGFEQNRVTLLFGLWDIESDFNPLSDAGRMRVVGLVIYMITYAFLGWIGVILMIIATSGMFPGFLQRGTVEVVLAKPMSRTRLFLYKYLAGLVFVLIQATLFVGLVFLVMGLRWRVWAPGYLLSIPLVVLLFSYVYCISVLVAVRTKSSVAAILLSIGAWVLYVCPPTAVQTFEQFPPLKQHERLYSAMRALSWIPPKTGEIPYLAARWAGAGTSIDVFPSEVLRSGANMGSDEIDRTQAIEQRELNKNPVVSIGSSLLFEAVIVAFAMWSFARKDY